MYIEIVTGTNGTTSLKPAEELKFTCKEAVKWSLDPPIGTIDEAGNYAAPEVIASERKVSVIALDASSKELGRYQVILRPSEDSDSSKGSKQILFGLEFSTILYGLVAIVMAICVFDPPRMFHELRDAAYARGVITFFIVVAAIVFGMTLVLEALYGSKDTGGERFRRGREVHSVLVGVMGTIVGFYFGTTGKQEAELQLTPLQVVSMGKERQHLSAYASGGQAPYTYSVSFVPADKTNTNGIPAEIKDGISDGGWIVYDFNCSRELTAKVTVKDKRDQQKEVIGRIRAEDSQPSTGATNSEASRSVR